MEVIESPVEYLKLVKGTIYINSSRWDNVKEYRLAAVVCFFLWGSWLFRDWLNFTKFVHI